LDALRPRSTTFGAFHDPELGFVGSVLSLNVNPSGAILPLLDTIAHQPPGGLLLNLYGAGSGPDLSAIAGKIAALSNVGWLCVGRSICLRGTTDWSRYAATHCLVDTPLISASDMTLEAATVKLMAALARPIGQGEWFRKNVAGESSG
jgi:L-asparaginase/Glu-tRNA(Gln) amidotransferase subunit D